jgi:hypothetical protein
VTKQTAAKKVAAKKTPAKKAAPVKKAKPKATPIKYEFFPLGPEDRGVSLPLNCAELDGLYVALDAITLAAEGGKLTHESWVRECFGTVDSFEAFLEELSSYDDCYRIHDRWWAALAHLAGSENYEEGFITTEDMANSLRDAAQEANQL